MLLYSPPAHGRRTQRGETVGMELLITVSSECDDKKHGHSTAEWTRTTNTKKLALPLHSSPHHNTILAATAAYHMRTAYYSTQSTGNDRNHVRR